MTARKSVNKIKKVCFPEKRNNLNAKEQVFSIWVLIKALFSYKIIRIGLLATIILISFPIIIFFIYRPHIQNNINYGVTFSNKYATELGLNWKDAYIKTLDDLEVRNLRLVAYWDEVESQKNVYDFSNIKWQLDEAEKRNVSVILVMGKKTLRWPECFEPNWVKSINNEELRQLALLSYVNVTVKELKGYDSIKMWQVENEPFFPFGICDSAITKKSLKEEIAVVRGLDSRPILVQDSGEGGFWYPSYKMGDYLGISMYRKIWYDFWGVFFKRFIYFKYPLAYWSYKVKAGILQVPYQKIFVTELQAEPWGPAISSKLSEKEKNKSMSRTDFLSTISYAQKAGFKNLYFWGVEWWLWEKEVNNNPFFWDTAKVLFRD